MALPDFGIRVVALGVAEFRRDVSGAQRDLDNFAGAIRSASGTSSQLGRAISDIGRTVTSVGRTLSTGLTLPLSALIGLLVNSGIEFEHAFSGVSKTVDGIAVGFDEIAAAAQTQLGITVTNMDEARSAAALMGMQFGQLTTTGLEVRDEFRQMGLDIPIATTELAALGETVGQLGVESDQIAEVTRNIALLGVATDLAAEDAAFGLIRFGNILEGTNLDVLDFVKSAGSALVALGNSSVSTEGEILNLTLRIAAAGDRAKFTAPEIMAWATTLSDVGVRAELGGTAVSRAITEMLLAVQTGSDNIETFAEVAGQSVEEFSAAFEDDASAALLHFVESLEAGIREGRVTKDMLTDLGLSGVRAVDVMGRLGNVTDLFATNLDTANEGWEEQIALQEEAEKRFITIKSQIQLVKNAFTDLGITIFDLVRDDLKAFADNIRELIGFFQTLDPSVQRTILKIASFATILGPALIVLGLIISAIGSVISLLSAIGLPLLAAAGLIALLAIELNKAFGPEIIAKIRELGEVIQGLSSGEITITALIPPEIAGSLEAIGTSIGGIAKHLSEFDVSGFEGFVSSLKDTAVATASKIWTSIGEAIAVISAASAEALQHIAPLVESIQGVAESSLAESFQNLSLAMKDMKATSDELSKAWEMLKVNAAELLPAILLGLAFAALTVVALLLALVEAASFVARGIVQAAEKFAEFAQHVNSVIVTARGILAVFGEIIGAAYAVGFAIINGANFGEAASVWAVALSEGLTKLAVLFDAFVAQVFAAIGSMVSGILILLTTLVGGGVSLVDNFVSNIIQLFTDLWMTLVGGSIVPDMVLAIIQQFTTLASSVLEVLTGWVAAVIALVTALKVQFEALISSMTKNLLKHLIDFGDKAGASLTGMWSAINKVRSAFQSLLNWLVSNVGFMVEMIGAVAGAIGAVNAIAMGSPELKIFYAFENFNDLLNTKVGDMTSNIGSLTSALSAMNMMASPAAGAVSNTTNNSMQIGSINGVPLRNEEDVADILATRWQFVNGG